MFWYRAWLDTRSRFLVIVLLLLCSGAATVLVYPRVREMLPVAAAADIGGTFGQEIRELAALQSDYRGYVWGQWFGKTFVQLATLAAALLGTGVLGRAGSRLFTLSLPMSRNRLLAVRALTGLMELAIVVLVGALIVPLISPAVGEQFAVRDALMYAVCVLIGGSLFFSIAFTLSTAFDDMRWPLVLTIAAAFLLALIESQLSAVLAPRDLLHVMAGETYFTSGRLPWTGLVVSASLAAVLMASSTLTLNRRDF